MPLSAVSPALPGVLCACVLLSACSLIKPDRQRNADDEGGASAARVDERRARYSLDVRAPRALDRLLSQNLDLARFRDAPPSEGLTDEELDRLIVAAPEQARDLLRTEGYFNAQVQVSRQPAGADGRPTVRVTVEPGPRTVVSGVDLRVQGDLAQRRAAGEADASRLLDRLQADWALPRGEPFRQADWTAAKNSTLAGLHAGGYPSAVWLHTEARVRSREQQVDLSAEAQSGPRFFLGPMKVEGLERYRESAVRNLAGFGPGTPYTEQALLDFQDRLRRSGLFEGAVAEIDPDPAKAAATPVTVRVQEQRLQQATLGLGYSSDTGARATLEHTHRRPFGLHWVAQNNLEFGNQRKQWEFDFRSHPLPEFKRNLVSGNVERWSGPDEERRAQRLRVGREQDRTRIHRLAYVELNQARVRTPQGVERQAHSLSAHYDWTRRAVDNLVLPTRGHALVLQSAVGQARSSTAENGPFGRAYGRALWFKPFGGDWHARLRLELGQVFAAERVGVPDTLLFRAGGEESVRGYAFRSLGPVVDGVVTSGRSLLTASAEVARPIHPRFPQVWGAAFVDAGNAAERFQDLRPKVGVGVGLRVRSPVGPLRADLAYGVDERRVRFHLSAGVSF